MCLEGIFKMQNRIVLVIKNYETIFSWLQVDYKQLKV